MNRRSLHKSGPEVRAILEETAALLRRTPAGVLLSYYVGAIPFWLALLYFVADMSQSGYAAQRLLPASLGVGALFLWGKAWECYFTSRLRDTLLRGSEAPWTPGRVARMILFQMMFQPWGLILRFITMQIILPTGWVLSFCHNLSVFGDGVVREGESAAGRAWKAARVWPWQALGIISALSLFGFIIWLNVAFAIFMAPALLKQFFGIETMASRDLSALFNTTFITISIAVTMMCVGPWWKAAFVLRCFYSESLGTGADLRLALRSFAPRARGIAALLATAALAWGMTCASLRAADPRNPPPAPSAVDPESLDQSINRVLERREYAWRVPRPPDLAPDKSHPSEMRLIKWFDSVSDWIGRMIRKLFDSSDKKDHSGSETGGAPPVKAVMIVLAGLAIALVAWAIWWTWGNRRPETAAATAIPATPDLEREDVGADELPEAGWLQYARELAEKGEWRLALRAAYLAGLAHLGQRELLTIARYKSNREYGQELRRRARARQELLSAFDENLLVFEGAWYGRHAVTPDVFSQFTQNLERIKAC